MQKCLLNDQKDQLSFVEDFWNEVEQGLSGATKDELTVAIEKCKLLVLQTQPFSNVRKCLITRLIELRRQLYALQEDEEVPRVFFINGHEFVCSKRNLGGSYVQYCERCCGVIWTLLQKWLYCRQCGYCAHKKCVSRICQSCVSIAMNENPAYELAICPEQGLQQQKYRCPDCRDPILIDIKFAVNPEVKTAVLCDYSGLYYCNRCHWNEKAAIPARVIHNWDFEPRPVSHRSLVFIRMMQHRPVLRLEALNPTLFANLEELRLVKKMRNDLLLMRPYLQMCREVARLCLLRHLRPYVHFIDTSDVYSMQDLIDISNGVLVTRFRETLDIFRQHIKMECDACRGNGYLCELCQDKSLLFPFDEFVAICRQCSAVFHRLCFDRTNGICSRCVRRSSLIAKRLCNSVVQD